MHWGVVAKEITRCTWLEQHQLLFLKELLSSDPFITYNAAVLRAADMIQSFGLDRESCVDNTWAFHDEVNSDCPLQPRVKLIGAGGLPEPAKALFAMLKFCGAAIVSDMSLGAVFPTPGLSIFLGGIWRPIRRKPKDAFRTKRRRA
jgi:hypothetical protein